MARGNQREKAREANLKKQAAQVSATPPIAAHHDNQAATLATGPLLAHDDPRKR